MHNSNKIFRELYEKYIIIQRYLNIYFNNFSIDIDDFSYGSKTLYLAIKLKDTKQKQIITLFKRDSVKNITDEIKRTIKNLINDRENLLFIQNNIQDISECIEKLNNNFNKYSSLDNWIVLMNSSNEDIIIDLFRRKYKKFSFTINKSGINLDGRIVKDYSLKYIEEIITGYIRAHKYKVKFNK